MPADSMSLSHAGLTARRCLPACDQAMRTIYEPLFLHYGVDLVLSGHVHSEPSRGAAPACLAAGYSTEGCTCSRTEMSVWAHAHSRAQPACLDRPEGRRLRAV